MNRSQAEPLTGSDASCNLPTHHSLTQTSHLPPLRDHLGCHQCSQGGDLLVVGCTYACAHLNQSYIYSSLLKVGHDAWHLHLHIRTFTFILIHPDVSIHPRERLVVSLLLLLPPSLLNATLLS